MLNLKSILFVPANRSDLVKKATVGAATGVCLDLEDGVAPEAKANARGSLDLGIEAIQSSNKVALVRINSEQELVSYDIESVPATTDAIVLPKVGSLHQVNLLGESLDRIHGASGPSIIGLVESGADIDRLRLDSGCRPHHRFIALMPGTEDLSSDLGVNPASGLVGHVLYETAILCSRWGVSLLGFQGSIAEIHDLDLFQQGVEIGVAAGAVGAFAIHPHQVAVLNDCFSVSDHDRANAQKIIATFDEALSNGVGAISLDGKMVDKPVYLRAKRILART